MLPTGRTESATSDSLARPLPWLRRRRPSGHLPPRRSQPTRLRLRTGGLPASVHAEVSAEAALLADLTQLENIAGDSNDPKVRSFLALYRQTAILTCIADFEEFDPANIKHRYRDQIAYGFPYTSTRYPWPYCRNGEPLQPALQINLREAGAKLGQDIGSGIVQIWIEPAFDNETLRFPNQGPVTRHISESELAEEISWAYPAPAPWLTRDGAVWSLSTNTRFIPNAKTPLIRWTALRHQFPHSLEICEKSTIFSKMRDLEVMSDIDFKHFSLLNFLEYITNSQAPRLGGYTVDWGENSLYYHPESSPDTFPENKQDWRLLFHVQYFNGLGPSGLYLKTRTSDSGRIQFECDIFERLNR